MRLKSIKLAGFKSFVDPTTVSLPSNLCAVVGPNGCGKSNIIDAVRWVMGESSAKNLRGEQMTDVIFNGSSNRKPVGQASVELVFDNSDHTITGEYAAYNEISIKRSVTTDAQSTYFLNGTKCRRRDITDIFLGTGLGPRSYSIIEQGMVSRLIESKPEELRIFIEEAAGISKYKERRRETENRIKRTKENLERLTDIRDELERQLKHLERQAAAAEKYREFKKEEREKTAQLNSLRWQSLNQEVEAAQQAIDKLQIDIEASIAEQRKFDADIEQLRSDNIEATDNYQKIQQNFYSLGSEIARIEQTIESQKQRKGQLEDDLQTTSHGLENAQRELKEDQEKITSLQSELTEVSPQMEQAKETENLSLQRQDEAEQVMQQWQASWDEFNKSSAESTRNAEVEQQRINHLDNIVERGQQRKKSLEQEQANLVAGPEEEDINKLDSQITELREQHDGINQKNASLGEQIDTVRQSIRAHTDQLNDERAGLQSLLGRRSSLEALQQAALSQGESALQWLSQNNLGNSKRLVDDLKVSDGWQEAVETVLGQHLQAVCVDGLDSLSDILESFTEGELNLLDLSASSTSLTSNNSSLQDRALLAKVTSSQSLSSYLEGVYCADNLNEALSLRSQLQGAESIVTPQGIWLSKQWLRVARGFDEKAGTLKRQEELEVIAGQIEKAEAKIADQVKQLEASQTEQTRLESEREALMGTLSQLNQQLSELKSERSGKMMKIEQFQERRTRLEKELVELARQLETEQENISNSRATLQIALDQMEKDTEAREELLKSRDEYRINLDETRQKARHDREVTHQLSLRHQTLSAQLGSMENALNRMNSQVSSLEQRKAGILENLKTIEEPLPELQNSLSKNLKERLEIESTLTESKARVDKIEHEMRLFEKQRNQAQEQTQQLRDSLSNRRLSIEGASVKRAAIEQSMSESQFDIQVVLNSLPEELTDLVCEQELERIGNRIQRLGAINLAAIDEYSTQSERKQYLDAQNEDLEKALKTLESAIRKIDRETRTRFKETFDKVNQGLQELFPKVFGGGHAYLDMVGDDLLDTGVAIMARPPGKKNSTIHLLSGGEKAMTAIALVFSIFQLNPSPFCMLDEVDAPLDDANVGRYANLVKEMSEKVQFIFITHNRITMEEARQLLGVTMHEPGVSRLVAVDVDEAAELAAM